MSGREIKGWVHVDKAGLAERGSESGSGWAGTTPALCHPSSREQEPPSCGDLLHICIGPRMRAVLSGQFRPERRRAPSSARTAGRSPIPGARGG